MDDSADIAFAQACSFLASSHLSHAIVIGLLQIEGCFCAGCAAL